MSLVEQGLVDNVVGLPSHFLVSKFGNRTVNVPKHMLIAVPTEAPYPVVQVELNFQIHRSHEEDTENRAQEAVSAEH